MFSQLLSGYARLPVWTVIAVSAFFAAVYSVEVALLSKSLPSLVPTHFGLDGTANDWMSKKYWIAFSLVFLWALALFMGGVATFLKLRPAVDLRVSLIFSLLSLCSVALVTGTFWAINWSFSIALRNAWFWATPLWLAATLLVCWWALRRAASV